MAGVVCTSPCCFTGTLSCRYLELRGEDWADPTARAGFPRRSGGRAPRPWLPERVVGTRGLSGCEVGTQGSWGPCAKRKRGKGEREDFAHEETKTLEFKWPTSGLASALIHGAQGLTISWARLPGALAVFSCKEMVHQLVTLGEIVILCTSMPVSSNEKREETTETSLTGWR